MALGIPLAGWAAISAAASAGATVYSGNQNASAQKKSAAMQRQSAEKAAKQQDQAFNAANQKDPNIAALLQMNRARGAGGAAGTFLTGQGGAPPSGQLLGRSTALGR